MPLRQSVIDLNPFGPTAFMPGRSICSRRSSSPAAGTPIPSTPRRRRARPEYLFSPELTVRSDWERHALNFDIHGAYLGYGSTFFPNSPVWLNRPGLDSRVNARIDVDTHDHFDLEGRLLLATDNPGSPNIQAGLETLPIVAHRRGDARLYSRVQPVRSHGERHYRPQHLAAIVPDRRHLFEQRRPQFRPVWRLAARQLRSAARRQAVLRGRRRRTRPRHPDRQHRRHARFRRPDLQGRHQLPVLGQAHRRNLGRPHCSANIAIRRCRKSRARSSTARCCSSRPR